MKIVLSRKGFDSGYGGYPSPVLPDGRLVSFPIPDPDSPIKYQNLQIDCNTTALDLITDLIGQELKLEGVGKKFADTVGCHLDPDLDISLYKRKDHWKGLFGQSGAAFGHLSNLNVSAGDLFLFFGWFREVEYFDGKYCYSKADKKGRHMLFGYMQVGDIKKINACCFQDWMSYHPHVSRGQSATDSDHIFIAEDRLSLDPTLPGYGTFTFNKKILLTKDGMSKSKWNLPEIFKNTSISYHSESSWKEGYFQSAAKGQEFVINATDDIQSWALDIIRSSRR